MAQPFPAPELRTRILRTRGFLTKKEPKPKLLSPDIFWWGGGLPREGVGAKKFGMSLETQGIKLSSILRGPGKTGVRSRGVPRFYRPPASRTPRDRTPAASLTAPFFACCGHEKGWEGGGVEGGGVQGGGGSHLVVFLSEDHETGPHPRATGLSTTKAPQTVTLQVTILCQQISKKKQHAPEHSFGLTLRQSFVTIFWQKNLTKLKLAVLPFAVL